MYTDKKTEQQSFGPLVDHAVARAFSMHFTQEWQVAIREQRELG